MFFSSSFFKSKSNKAAAMLAQSAHWPWLSRWPGGALDVSVTSRVCWQTHVELRTGCPSHLWPAWLLNSNDTRSAPYGSGTSARSTIGNQTLLRRGVTHQYSSPIYANPPPLSHRYTWKPLLFIFFFFQEGFHQRNAVTFRIHWSDPTAPATTVAWVPDKL